VIFQQIAIYDQLSAMGAWIEGTRRNRSEGQPFCDTDRFSNGRDRILDAKDLRGKGVVRFSIVNDQENEQTLVGVGDDIATPFEGVADDDARISSEITNLDGRFCGISQ
jgi:hypothetical protein